MKFARTGANVIWRERIDIRRINLGFFQGDSIITGLSRFSPKQLIKGGFIQAVERIERDDA